MQSILEGIWPFFGIITLVCGYFIFKATSKRWFAWFMDSWVVRYESAVKPIKTEHFATLKDVVSKDPLLNSKGLFRLVEIGAGTGANLQYYSSNAEITVVDVNRHMEKYFIKNQEKHKDLHFGQYVVATAEDMKGIKSGSVDVVVETKLMCSVVDAEAVFKEVARVLAPGGRFYFWDHCINKQSFLIRLQQRCMDMSRIFRFLFCNCHYARDIHAQFIQTTKRYFSQVECQEFCLDVKDLNFDVFPIRTHVSGVAVK